MVHANCNICTKKTFFSRAEFLEAHGGKITFIPASPWITKTTRKGNKNSPFLVHELICKGCKSNNSPNHKTNCSYYWEGKNLLSPSELFDWEEYWKWWFGVLTLDLDSKRFFGKF